MKTLEITILPCRGSAVSHAYAKFVLPLTKEPTVAEQRSLLKAAQAQLDASLAHPLVDQSTIPPSRHGEAEVRFFDTSPKSEGVSTWIRTGKRWSPQVR